MRLSWMAGGLLLGLMALAQQEPKSLIDRGVLSGEAQPANRWLVRLIKRER